METVAYGNRFLKVAIDDLVAKVYSLFVWFQWSVLQVGTGDNVAAVASFFQSNQIPIVFLVMLLLQFLSMLVDR